MKYLKWIRRGILMELAVLLLGMIVLTAKNGDKESKKQLIEVSAAGDYIKWVDFKVSYEALCRAYELDIKTHGGEKELHWIELLAYAAARTGGEVGKQGCGYMDEIAEQILNGDTTMKKAAKDLKYYPYYLEAYSAILDGFVGEYEIRTESEKGEMRWEKCYGLKAFSPVAKGFYYEDYDDFGASRSYGYARPHLGHDMMGQVGTPKYPKNDI